MYIVKFNAGVFIMANNRSSKKRIYIANRNRLANRSYSAAYRTEVCKFYSYIDSQNLNLAYLCLNRSYSLIDKAQKCNILHKSTAARKKSILAQTYKKANE